jgi:two-component system sensor histidine kinase BaeS
MKISLHYKLFGAILTAILVVVLYMTLVLQWSFDRGFLNYVNTAEHGQLLKIADDLGGLYKDEQSWQWLVDDPRKAAVIIVESYPEGRQKERFLQRLGEKKFDDILSPSGPLPTDIPVHFFRRVFLLDENGQTILGYNPDKARPDVIKIYNQNRVVGSIGVHPAKYLSDSHHLVFVHQQKLTLLLVAVAGVLIAAGLSLPISYMMTRPIRRMVAATRSLASGIYTTRLRVSSIDETGQLAQDLNNLADILEKNRIARSQWIADISHELRTPLSILRGKIEALQDGVYKPTAETFRGLHTEVMHLGLLVDDLYQLSLSDVGAMSYSRTEVQPCWALEQAITLLESELKERSLTLETAVNISEDDILFADNERLKQLFTNLLANSIRYTDRDGSVHISVMRQGAMLVYIVEDSAPGVSAEHLGKLFDRLYRVDASRSRDLGGAGLGLSICYNIVKGHNGSITAGHSVLGGLLIRVELPVAE